MNKIIIITLCVLISQVNCAEISEKSIEIEKKEAKLIYPEPYMSQQKSWRDPNKPYMAWVPNPIEVQPWQLNLPPISTKLAGNCHYFGVPSSHEFKQTLMNDPADKVLVNDYLFLYNDHVERLKRDIQLRKDGLLKTEEGEIDFIRYYPCQSYPEFKLWKIELHKRRLTYHENKGMKERALQFNALKQKYERMGIKEEEYKKFNDMKLFYPFEK